MGGLRILDRNKWSKDWVQNESAGCLLSDQAHHFIEADEELFMYFGRSRRYAKIIAVDGLEDILRCLTKGHCLVFAGNDHHEPNYEF